MRKPCLQAAFLSSHPLNGMGLQKGFFMDKLARDKEEKLIARSQQGDIRAFNQLVLCQQQVVDTTVFRILGDYATPPNCTQTTFLSPVQALHPYLRTSH